MADDVQAPNIRTFLKALANRASDPYLTGGVPGISDLRYDASDKSRLALRGFDAKRQIFVGITARASARGIGLRGHCPECRIEEPLCVHARSLLLALRNVTNAYDWEWRLPSWESRFLRDPTVGLWTASARVQAMADIFDGPLPAYRAPLPDTVEAWITRLAQAELEEGDDDATPEGRTVRLPDAAQLRFRVDVENNLFKVRPVYMAPGEVLKTVRLVDLDAADTARRRQILERLTAQERSWLRQMRGWERDPGPRRATFLPATELDQELLAEWIGEGRAELAPVAGAVEAALPLSLAAPLPLSMQWEVTHQLMARLRLSLPERGRLIALPSPWWLDDAQACLTPIEGVSTAQLLALRQTPMIARDHIDQFTAALKQAGLTLAVPEPQAIPEPIVVEVEPRAQVVLSAFERPGREPVVAADLFFNYGRGRIAPTDERAPRVIVRVAGELLAHPRRPDRELAIQRTLDGMGLRSVEVGRHGEQRRLYQTAGLPSATAIALMAQLRAKNIEVELAPSLGVQILVDAALDTYTDVDDGGGAMIGVDSGIVVDGERLSLVQIADIALRDPSFRVQPGEQAEATEADRRIFVPLDERRIVSLPHARVHELLDPFLEWLTTLTDTPRAARAPRIEIPRAAVLAMAFDPEDDRATWLALPGLDRLRETVRRLREKGIEHVAPTPAGFHGELRKYQQVGVRWLNTLGELGLGGALADDMGLGKTIQALTHIMMRRQEHTEDPVLVVAPKSVVDGWVEKAAQFTPSLRLVNLTGPDRAERVGEIATADIVVCNYTTMRLDIEVLEKQHWSLVVFDESQFLKNSGSQSHAVARRLQADRVLMVSGTPMENHLGELHAQLSLALPGLLGTTREFNKFYRNPIEKHGDNEARRKLRRRFAPFLLQRPKDEVLSELPKKTEILRTVALLPEQQKLYDTHKLAASRKVWEALHARGLANAQITMLQQIQRLQLICCHPSLNTGAPGVGGSAKVEEILDIVRPILEEGRRVVIVSQYVKFLRLIGAELERRGHAYFTFFGSTRNRDAVKQAFQRGECPLMLLSLKAGGVGLDLTAADNVIVASPWWNPMAERQAIDRTHRIGQLLPVFAYRVICENTIEVEVLSRQATKTNLFRSIFGADDAAGESILTLDDVVAMFGVDPTTRAGEAIDVEFREVPKALQQVYPDNEDDDEPVIADDAERLPQIAHAGNGTVHALPSPPAKNGNGHAHVAAPAPRDGAAREAASVEPGSTPDRVQKRIEVANWVRTQMREKKVSVSWLNDQLGKTTNWLSNRLILNGNARFGSEDLRAVGRLIGVPVPPAMLAIVDADTGRATPEGGWRGPGPIAR